VDDGSGTRFVVARITRSARATGLLVGGTVTACEAALGVFLAIGVVLACLLGVGLLVLPELVRPLREIAAAERRRVSRATGWRIGEPYRRADEGPRRQRARVVLTDPATWRDLAWMLVHGSFGVPAVMLAVVLWPSVPVALSIPLWWWAAPRGSVSAFITLTSWPEAVAMPLVEAAVYAAALGWLIPLAARWQLRLAHALLRPTGQENLAERVRELTESRAGALEAHAAELRRIERDLHDGTQANLVSVAIRLGLAERNFADEPENALGLLRDAKKGVEDVLTQLRGVIRSIYPPILADRGLAGAVAALASGQRVPVTVTASGDLPRLPAAVEAAAYYVAAEALTNMSKHSGATHATVSIAKRGLILRVIVQDNGTGGASDSGGGTGLAGITRRVAALDGTTRIDSPAGTGTTIEVELPCEW
jgi:signal transduction histidine kinase